MSQSRFGARYVIEVPITETVTIRDDAGGIKMQTTTTGKRAATIEVEVDLAGIVRMMGTKAVLSKGGKCVDGFVTVRRV
jgi:hypothetical protein